METGVRLDDKPKAGFGYCMKTRFAPSPTGYLHLGNARAALFNALLALHEGGRFLLRIEDSDLERSTDAFVRAIEEDLKWLGLEWQEGYHAQGAAGPYRQSQREPVYQRYYQQLLERSAVYPCFCTVAELGAWRRAQLAAGRPPRYPGTCAALTPEDVQARLDQGMAYTLRYRVPPRDTVEFDDMVRGVQRTKSQDIGDFVIRRADGRPMFFFANALDDALMGITHVLRGEDHLSNTPRQLLLLRSLGLNIPRYGHLPLLVGEDNTPLAKRGGSESLRALKAEGYLPAAIVNYLARLGARYEPGVVLDLKGLARTFDYHRLSATPVGYDPDHLRYWQQRVVASIADDALWRWMGAEVHALVPPERWQQYVQAVRPNLEFPRDALHWAEVLFSDSLIFDEHARRAITDAGKQFFVAALAAFAAFPDDFAAFVNTLKSQTGARGKSLFLPLRAALTGQLAGPELKPLTALLGAHRVRMRLSTAAEQAAVENS